MKEHPHAAGPQAGIHEVSPEQFDETLGAVPPGATQSLDLKALLPEVFTRQPRGLPRLLGRIWRQVADDIAAAGRGFYTYRGNGVIDMFFGMATGEGAAADFAAKVRIMLDAPPESEGGLRFQPAEAEPAPSDSEVSADAPPRFSDIAWLMKNGLGDNPSLPLLHLWAARLTHELVHSPLKVPLLQEMLDLVARSDISYLPFWDSETRMIEGSLAQLRDPAPPDENHKGAVLRQDLSLLFAAVVQILYLGARGAAGTIIVPLRAATLADGPCVDLCHCFLRRLSREAAACLMIEVRGLGRTNVPSAIADAIRSLSDGTRGFIFATGAENYTNYRHAFPVLHGQSIDISGSSFEPRPHSVMIHRYARHCRKLGLKSFISGVADMRSLSTAGRAEYTYISGPVLLPAQQTAFARQALPGRVTV
jgi:hypothetical protein